MQYFLYPILTFWLCSSFFYFFKLDKFTNDNEQQIIPAIIGMLILNIPQIFSTVIMELNPMFMTLDGFRWSYFLFGIFIIDTMEYFLHRLYHFKFLYKFHKIHHEIKDPFSFAAFYNSFSEAIITSTIITTTMIFILGFTLQEFTIVYCFAIVATVMDHCDWFYQYKNHHWIHHKVNQNCNYQQPFFDYWDRLLGTKH